MLYKTYMYLHTKFWPCHQVLTQAKTATMSLGDIMLWDHQYALTMHLTTAQI
jgi:hypothetical protein